MASRKSKGIDLIPPDLKRCQCERANGGAFSLGPVKRWRCRNKAKYIATENRPDAEGVTGSMALCNRCATKLIEIKGGDYATLEIINIKKGQ